MNFEPSDRFAGLATDPAIVSVQRSAAKREASRRNGRLSRGPRTAAGKARSKLNATKHGLFARVTAPPGGYNECRKLHRRFHRDLVAEFDPQTFTQRALISSLASDFVSLARARRMAEFVAQPRVPSPKDEETYECFVRAKSDIRLLEGALAAYNAGKSPRYPAHQAKRLAASISTDLEQVVSNLEEPEEDPDQDAEPAPQEQGGVDAVATDKQQNLVAALDAQDAEELRPFRELIESLGPSLPRLRDRSYVEAILSGRKRLGKADNQAFQKLLTHSLQSWRRWVHGQRGLAAKTRRLNANTVRALVQVPERLMALDEFVHRVEQAIGRKLRQIDAW